MTPAPAGPSPAFQTASAIARALTAARAAALPSSGAAPRVAVLLPCRDEAKTIGGVVRAFRRALPTARVYVYDNGSRDGTAAFAEAAGATVRREPSPGKGNVVRRMFAEVDADVYVLADGDGTYDAAQAPRMVSALRDCGLDMVVGTRQGVCEDAHRPGHGIGNRLFNILYRQLFGPGFTDVFSGYRVFSRRFVRSFPAVSTGFEIETEMSVHASQLRLPVAEIPTVYGARASGTASKLHTVRDALRILRTMLLLYKEVRPVAFYGTLALTAVAGSLALGVPIIDTYLRTGLVPRLPSAVLATGLAMVASIMMACGLIVDSIARGRVELKRLAYLQCADRSGSST